MRGVIDALKFNDQFLLDEIEAVQIDIINIEADIADIQSDILVIESDIDDINDRMIRTGTASGAITIGDVLYAPSNGTVSRAVATAEASSYVIGIALQTVTNGNPVQYQVAGAVALTGVTAGDQYYLSANTAGSVVSTPDAVAGEYIVLVGRAPADGIMLIAPGSPILL